MTLRARPPVHVLRTGLLALLWAASSAAQTPKPNIGEPIDFGLRVKGGPYKVTLFAANDCKTPHTVRFAVTTSGSWLKIGTPRTITIPPSDEKWVDATFDTSKLNPGTHFEDVKLTCTTCTGGCGASVTNRRASVTVPAANTFGAALADGQMGGLVGGKPVPIGTLIGNVLTGIKATTYGSTPRAKKIIERLENHYLDNDLSDVTIVPTIDKAGKEGRIESQTPAVNGEAPKPGNASYVREQTVAYIWMEEIYLGVDMSTAGIHQARQSPKDYYVFTHGGKMGVIKKSELVHNLIHEGLHAVQGGKYNVSGRAPIEEERDAFKEGNAAAKAMGLPPAVTRPGAGGYGAKSNPSYTPLSLNLPSPADGTEAAGGVPVSYPSCDSEPFALGCEASLPSLASCAAGTASGCDAASDMADVFAGVSSLCSDEPTLAGCDQLPELTDACAAEPFADGCQIPFLVAVSGVGPVCGGVLADDADASGSCDDYVELVSAGEYLLPGCDADPFAPSCAPSLVVGSACGGDPFIEGCDVLLPRLDCGDGCDTALYWTLTEGAEAAATTSTALDLPRDDGRLTLTPDTGAAFTNAPAESEPYAYTLDAATMNLPSAASAARVRDVQLMIVMVMKGRTPGSTASGAAQSGPRAGARLWNASFGTSATWQTPAPRPSVPPLKAELRALGVSTGRAFDLSIVNDAPYGVDFAATGVVVEPIAAGDGRKVREDFADASEGRGTWTSPIDAYCLEYLRQPPPAGMSYRVAGPEIQERFQPMRNVASAAKRLFDAGALSPDSDPAEYFHSIVQWSLWSKEQGFDVRSFGDAFVERTRKNFDAAGQAWTSQIETVVRGLVPNRWTDVQRVLEEAVR